jgi:transposase
MFILYQQIMYSLDTRLACSRAYFKLHSLRKTADLLGISKSTIQRWVQNHPVRKKQRDTRRATRIAVTRINEILQSNPFETPKTISEIIRKELGIALATSTVRFWVKRCGLSRKKTNRRVMSDQCLTNRLEYSKRYASVYDPERVISIDESSFYFDMKPQYGYCRRSSRLVVPARPGGRMRWSLLMADFRHEGQRYIVDG